MPDQRPVEPAPQIVDPFSQQPAQPRAPDGRFAAAGTPAPQPEPAQHPQWLIEQAYDLGISEEDIQALSPDALGRACRQLTKQQQLMRQENSRARAVDLPPTQPAQPAAGSDPWANFNFAEVHPSIAAVLQSQRDEIAKLKGIETEFRQDKEQRVQSERQQNHDMIDDAIADLVSKLGPDGARLYGTKPGRAMDVNSDEWRRRLAILQCGGVDVTKVNSGRIYNQVARGHQVLFGAASGNGNGQKPAAAAAPENPYAQPPRPGVQGAQGAQRFTPDQWAQGGLAMPTDRQDVPIPEGPDRAVANLTARLNNERTPANVKGMGFFSG